MGSSRLSGPNKNFNTRFCTWQIIWSERSSKWFLATFWTSHLPLNSWTQSLLHSTEKCWMRGVFPITSGLLISHSFTISKFDDFMFLSVCFPFLNAIPRDWSQYWSVKSKISRAAIMRFIYMRLEIYKLFTISLWMVKTNIQPRRSQIAMIFSSWRIWPLQF